ncbi:hemerythrin domain-containing protein [Nonomuraea endophytica]|uniref:Iron-sulfur cluster repair protein YtfE (RIC family) n=1 Tax=Nonomuraea endophytica TaxID=714136 RepID=A0A7W8A1J1_9ACTN|nr:hemerythrin domain-containing protein [Nonomuraea endophytica]MBB5076713.1 iron-sulfur cluster repair protein YtfE (RIC family) [Nonomuraea endophytica]
MSTVQIPTFTARGGAGQEPEPNLTSMYVIHRAMLADLRRLTALLARPGSLGVARVAVLREYVSSLLVEIDHHHANEDDLLWPIIERTAGPAVDLNPFTDDHAMLEPLLNRCRRAVHGDPAALGTELAELLALLDEHIAEEESDLFPIVSRFVPHQAYAWVEKQVAKRATLKELTFTVPWLASYATKQELDGLLADAGAPFRVLLAVTRGRYARRVRLLFG